MQTSVSQSDQFELSELMAFAWRNRWIIASCTLIFVFSAAVLWKVLDKRYEASVILLPVSTQTSSSGMGALGSIVSQLGSVGSLAGLGASAAGGSRAESVATLQSQGIVEAYIRDKNLLPVLFKGSWDSSTAKWKVPDPNKIPTLWRGMDYFRRSILNVTENAKTGLVTLTVTWTDPKVAAEWANDLVKATNARLREKAVAESQRNIDYLNEQAAKTATVEIRNSIFAVMESEIKKQMVAKGSEEYALKVVDEAIPPERHSFPRGLFFVSGGFLIGIVVGVIVAVGRQMVKSNRAKNGN